MSPFTLFALVLLLLVTVFALSNPMTVSLHFLSWRFETTLALAIIGAAVVGGFLVLVSSVVGQQQLRSRLRESQARLRELEARLHEPSRPGPGQQP
jgi:putative membrane protein